MEQELLWSHQQGSWPTRSLRLCERLGLHTTSALALLSVGKTSSLNGDEWGGATSWFALLADFSSTWMRTQTSTLITCKCWSWTKLTGVLTSVLLKPSTLLWPPYHRTDRLSYSQPP